MIYSINTAWLSVAASVAALVVPVSYGVSSQLDWLAVSLAAVFTVIGASLSHYSQSPHGYAMNAIFASL